MNCENENCTREATVKCTLTVYEERKFFRWLKELFHLPTWKDEVENLCAECAVDAGYCFACGNFYAGCKSYDLSPIKGCCENCISEFEEPEFDEFDYTDPFDDDMNRIGDDEFED